MENQVLLLSRFILAHRPHEANKILVAVFLIVWSKEEYRGENGSNIDEVGVGWLAFFDLEVFSSCFEERGKFFGQHGVQSCLLAWS